MAASLTNNAVGGNVTVIYGDTPSLQHLSSANMQLIQMLADKDKQILSLQAPAAHNTLAPGQRQQLAELQQQKQALEIELQNSAEILERLRKDKTDLEKQLAPEKEKRWFKSTGIATG